MQGVVQNLNETYVATPGSVAQGRTRLAAFAAGAGATSGQVDAVRLASSEAMTNCVVHAYRDEPGDIHLNAGVVSGELWILISDDGCGLAPRADRSGLGFGLGLISQLADEFAIASRASGGTEVRLRFDLSDDPSHPSANAASSDPRSVSHLRRPGFTPSMSAA